MPTSEPVHRVKQTRMLWHAAGSQKLQKCLITHNDSIQQPQPVHGHPGHTAEPFSRPGVQNLLPHSWRRLDRSTVRLVLLNYMSTWHGTPCFTPCFAEQHATTSNTVSALDIGFLCLVFEVPVGASFGSVGIGSLFSYQFDA